MEQACYLQALWQVCSDLMRILLCSTCFCSRLCYLTACSRRTSIADGLLRSMRTTQAAVCMRHETGNSYAIRGVHCKLGCAVCSAWLLLRHVHQRSCQLMQLHAVHCMPAAPQRACALFATACCQVFVNKQLHLRSPHLTKSHRVTPNHTTSHHRFA